MKAIRIGALCWLALAFAACGSSAPPPAEEPERALDAAIQAPLDKARALEDDVMKAKREQDARIEEQGG